MHPISTQPPGPVIAVSILHTVVGGLQAFVCLFWLAFFWTVIGMIPAVLYGVSSGISLYSGITGLTGGPVKSRFQAASILQIICVIGCDPISLGAGIAGLILIELESSKIFFTRREVESLRGIDPNNFSA